MKPTPSERAEALALLPHLKPDSVLDRRMLAALLTVTGRPISASTLASAVCRGDGPPMSRWGSRAAYAWGPACAWAEARSRVAAA